MKSFRIHSTQSSPNQRIPYLRLEFFENGRVALDFDALGEEAIPKVILTAQALYEILEGKVLSLARPNDSLTFFPEGDELKIVSEAPNGGPIHLYRVWRAEVGLAWNLLGSA